MSELLNCPFCGGSGLSIAHDVVEPDGLYSACIMCSGCDARGPDGILLPDGGWSGSPDEAANDAATIWNIRRTPKP